MNDFIQPRSLGHPATHELLVPRLRLPHRLPLPVPQLRGPVPPELALGVLCVDGSKQGRLLEPHSDAGLLLEGLELGFQRPRALHQVAGGLRGGFTGIGGKEEEGGKKGG